MSSPPPTTISTEQMAAAAERRASTLRESDHLNELRLHEKRQHFRRLIDPGIMRPNTKEVAIASLKTLLQIAENLLREPNNPKYRKIKPTNDIIKRRLVEPKGALEYAIALGFKPEVEDLQPFYAFNPQKLDDAAIGCAILKEALEIETEKHERALRAKREEKATRDAAAEKVKLAFLDDRKSKQLADQRERERRAALHEKAPPSLSLSSSPAMEMPGRGYSLTGDTPESVHEEEEPNVSSPTASSPHSVPEDV